MVSSDAAYVFGRLLDHLAENTRESLLVEWTGDDFRALVPLLVRGGGEAATLGAAREIVAIAAWFP